MNAFPKTTMALEAITAILSDGPNDEAIQDLANGLLSAASEERPSPAFWSTPETVKDAAVVKTLHSYMFHRPAPIVEALFQSDPQASLRFKVRVNNASVNTNAVGTVHLCFSDPGVDVQCRLLAKAYDRVTLERLVDETADTDLRSGRGFNLRNWLAISELAMPSDERLRALMGKHDVHLLMPDLLEKMDRPSALHFLSVLNPAPDLEFTAPDAMDGMALTGNAIHLAIHAKSEPAVAALLKLGHDPLAPAVLESEAQTVAFDNALDLAQRLPGANACAAVLLAHQTKGHVDGLLSSMRYDAGRLTQARPGGPL